MFGRCFYINGSYGFYQQDILLDWYRRVNARFKIYSYLLLQYRQWCHEIDEGHIPEGMQALLEELGAVKLEGQG